MMVRFLHIMKAAVVVLTYEKVKGGDKVEIINSDDLSS